MTYMKHDDKTAQVTDEMLDDLLIREDPGSALENCDLLMELRRRMTESPRHLHAAVSSEACSSSSWLRRRGVDLVR